MTNQVDSKMTNGTENRGRSGTSRTHASKSPARQTQGSRSPMRQKTQRGKKQSRSPKRNQQKNMSRSPNRGHGKNKSRSPMRRGGARKKKPAAMTVIINRCDLWDSAAHFQPDECFQPQNQQHIARALPFSFKSDEPSTQCSADRCPPGIEKQDEVKCMSVATARVPHHVESIQFPVVKQDNVQGTHHCDVIDTTIPNPHDPNVVHDKYWAQRR